MNLSHSTASLRALVLGLLVASAASAQQAGEPTAPATQALCQLWLDDPLRLGQLQALLDEGADPNGPCTLTITRRSTRLAPSSALGQVTRSLTRGKPTATKAIAGLALLPVLPMLAIVEGLGRVASARSSTEVVQVQVTPLHLAVESESAEGIAALIGAGADPALLDHRGLSPMALALGQAADNRRSQALAAVLEAGAPLRHLEPFPPQVLLDLARQPELFQLLCRYGLDPDAAPDPESTPLWLAVDGGHRAAARGLLTCGADPELSGRSGELPLDAAVSSGQVELLDLLRAQGANLETEDELGRSALARATIRDEPEALALLLERDSLLEHADDWGATALHQAAELSAPDCLALLLEAGADPTAIDDHGEQALHLALRKGRLEQARLLLDHGAPLQGTGAPGAATPLLVALSHWRVEETALLLERGAAPGPREEAWILAAGEDLGDPVAYRDATTWRDLVLLLLPRGLPVSVELLELTVAQDGPALAEAVFARDETSSAWVYRRLRRRARRASATISRGESFRVAA